VGALEAGWLCLAERPRWSFAGYAARREERKPERPPEEVHEFAGIALSVRTPSGTPVEDEAGFVLLKPDGSTEPARLSGGEFRKENAPQGPYRARFKRLERARWMATSIRCGEEIQLRVAAPGFDDGASVSFRIYREADEPDARPVAEQQSKVVGGEASVTWRHVQAQGVPAFGEYIFEAELGSKWASSGVLDVEPHPSSEVQGVKERLVQLGYDCGAPGPESTPALEEAVKKFQDSLGFPQPTGRVDENTARALDEVI
jgi:hypothetical protein